MSDQLVGCQGGCHVPRSELRDVELVVGRQGLVGWGPRLPWLRNGAGELAS